jgi:phage-related protein
LIAPLSNKQLQGRGSEVFPLLEHEKSAWFAFIKKTQQIPDDDMKLARKRKAEFDGNS